MKPKQHMLAFGLQDFEPHSRYETLPNHIPIVPLFESASIWRLGSKLRRIAEHTPSIQIELGESALLGFSEDKPAMLIAPNDGLADLQKEVAGAVTASGGLHDPFQAEYPLHVTNPDGVQLDDAYILDSFALFRKHGVQGYNVEQVFILHG